MATVKQVNFKSRKNSKSPLRKARADRWINATNEFGGAADPMTRTYFGRDYQISQTELDYLYEGDWTARRAIEIPAKDATRKWVTLNHKDDPAKAEPMKDEMERLDLQGKFNEAIILDRLYGGCAMIIGAFDGKEVDEPLGTIEKVDWIENVDRFHAYPTTFYQDPADPRFGTPETYIIQRLAVVGAHTMTVHESRIIRFGGAYLPPRLRIRNFGWGAPVFQALREALRQFGVSVQSGASILQDFITLALKIDNLSELIRDETGEAELLDRLAIMASERSTHNIAVYGADEDINKLGTPTSGLPELIDIFMDIVSAAVEIPKSRFFHNQTGRLGGDAGANDLRTHYDNISAFQRNQLSKKLQVVIDMIGEPMGHAPGDIGFEWNPLWQLSETELADQFQKTAQADAAYIQNGVLEPEEVAISRFGGDGLNLGDMTIDIGRRQAYLEQLAKQPVDLDEPAEDDPDPDNPEDIGLPEEQDDPDATAP